MVLYTNVIVKMNIFLVLFFLVYSIALILLYKAFLGVTVFMGCIKLYYYIRYNKLYRKIIKYFTLEYLEAFSLNFETTL